MRSAAYHLRLFESGSVGAPEKYNEFSSLNSRTASHRDAGESCMTSARIARILIAVGFVLLTSRLGFAAATVGPIVADPPQIQINIATTVKITAAITDPAY